MKTKLKIRFFVRSLIFIGILVLFHQPDSAYTQESGLVGSKSDKDSITIEAKVLDRDKDGSVCLDIKITNPSSTMLTNGIFRVSPAAMNSKFDFDTLKIKGHTGEQTGFYKEENFIVKEQTELNRKVCFLWGKDQPLKKFLIFIFVEGKIGTEPVMLKKIVSLQK